MPTFAYFDDGQLKRLSVSPPYDMPIVTFHVRLPDGSLRDAGPADLSLCGDITAIPDEQDADPAAPIVSRSHHTHSPLHRRFWPLTDPKSDEPDDQAAPAPDAGSLEVPGLSQPDPGAGEDAAVDSPAVSTLRSSGTEAETPTE